MQGQPSIEKLCVAKMQGQEERTSAVLVQSKEGCIESASALRIDQSCIKANSDPGMLCICPLDTMKCSNLGDPQSYGNECTSATAFTPSGSGNNCTSFRWPRPEWSRPEWPRPEWSRLPYWVNRFPLLLDTGTVPTPCIITVYCTPCMRLSC